MPFGPCAPCSVWLEQALCRCRVLQPGIDIFWKGIVGQTPAVDEQVVLKACKVSFGTEGNKLSLYGLVAEFLPVNAGDIPDCERLLTKELPNNVGSGGFVGIEIERFIGLM